MPMALWCSYELVVGGVGVFLRARYEPLWTWWDVAVRVYEELRTVFNQLLVAPH